MTTPRVRKELTPEQRDRKRATDKARKQELRDLAKQAEGRAKPAPKPPKEALVKPEAIKAAPKLDLAKQVQTLGADSLLPPKEVVVKAKIAEAAPKPPTAFPNGRMRVGDEDDEPILQRQPKPKVTARGKRILSPNPAPARESRVAPGIIVTMGKTYQREGMVASGTKLAGDRRQLAVVFPLAMFEKLMQLAQVQGVSGSEQVRQFVAQGLVNL